MAGSIFMVEGVTLTYLDRLNSFNKWMHTHYLSGNATLLFYRLLALFNEAGWPKSIQVDNFRLMGMIDTRTERVAILARDTLVEAGLVRYEKGKKKSPNAYFLMDCTQQKVSVSDSETVSEKGSGKCSHIKTKTKTKSPLYPPQGETGFGDDLQAAFESWLAYKGEKRQAYKPTGLKTLIGQIQRNAREHGEAAVADLIRDCMASNWQGIIWRQLKQTSAGQPQSEQPKRIYDPETGGWR